ncbi:MAG: M1 family metallopeptidase [Acidimicrobiaceae bacterium]|nr:M1 family metallopeptidase [Acidimicrobiaceae bacterium]
MTETAKYRLPRTVVPERYELELTPDLDAATFGGSSRVAVRVVEATDRFVLNAIELEITSAELFSPGEEPIQGRVTQDDELQRATIEWGQTVAPGEHELRLAFTGILNDKLHGFYRSTFTDDRGQDHVIATTQFEATDARRAFPCWDEPDLKATFAVTLVVDEHLTAISNGAPVSSESAGAGKRRVVFAETMRMSTYLVAFIVGPFELTDAIDVDGVPLRVAAMPGRSELTPFALGAGKHALEFLSRYFEIPYPAGKIDHVAIPDFAFGAMENVGCVTYREQLLLIDPDAAAQLELQRVASVIAHETAHMWFGNLVTMKWWNGIWLNEAFATFMELTTTDAFEPSWQMWTGFGAGKAAALGTDGLSNTRPVEFEVGSPEEAEAMFDVLTYQKGGSVLRMLEQYLGPDTFRRGIAHYLDQHRYGNTETADLWDAIESVSGEPVRTIMDSWILQGGYPTVAVSFDHGRLSLRQSRFLYQGDDEAARWAVPVNLRLSSKGSVSHHRLLLEGAEATLPVEGDLDWAVVNDGNWGFYRTSYSPDLLGRLTADLQGICNPLERLGLAGDTWAAVVAGRVPLSDWVQLVTSLGDERDPDVWSAAVAPFGLLDIIAAEADRPALQAFVRAVAGPAFDRLGWGQQDGEDARLGITRSRLIAALGTVGASAEVAEEAARRFAGYQNDPASLSPDLVTAAVNVHVASGGEAAYETVLDAYRHASTPQEKIRFLGALGAVTDPALAMRSLELSMSSEVRSQDAPFLIAGLVASRAGGERAWDWVTAHWDDISGRLPGQLQSRVLEGVTGLVDPDAAARVHAWMDSHTLPVAPVRLAQLQERMDINVALGDRIRKTLASELQPRRG